MKKITLLLTFLIASIGFSQTELLTNGDFSSGDANWALTGGSVVSNEAAFATTNAAGDPWTTQLVYGGLSFTNTQEYVLSFKARAAAARDITVAIQNVGIWNDQFRQNFSLTTTMATYTVTFNAMADNANVQIGFLLAGFGVTDGVYFDDVSLTTNGSIAETCSDGKKNQDETGIDCGGVCDACPVPPTTAPTAPPTRNAGDVISLYSEAYTNVTSNFDAEWCGANSIEEVSIAGNNVQAYKGNACQGIVLDAGIDASAFTNLHVDVYIEAGVDVTSKVFNLKFVQQPGAGALEVNFNAESTPPLVAGSWIAIDVAVDLSTFTGFKEFGITAGNLANQVWYDNLYVYKAATAGVSDNAALDVSMHPNPAAGVLNLSAANTIEDASIYNVLGREVMGLNIDSNSAAIDVSGLSSGIYLIKYTIGDAVGTAKFIKE